MLRNGLYKENKHNADARNVFSFAFLSHRTHFPLFRDTCTQKQRVRDVKNSQKKNTQIIYHYYCYYSFSSFIKCKSDLNTKWAWMYSTQPSTSSGSSSTRNRVHFASWHAASMCTLYGCHVNSDQLSRVIILMHESVGPCRAKWPTVFAEASRSVPLSGHSKRKFDQRENGTRRSDQWQRRNGGRTDECVPLKTIIVMYVAVDFVVGIDNKHYCRIKTIELIRTNIYSII